MVTYFGCYKFNKEWLLVEMALNISSEEIDWDSIVVPDEELDESDWQCPYMEQYLNVDGTEKICETYDEPEEEVNPCRIAFFIYKEGSRTLRTPYGDFDCLPVEADSKYFSDYNLKYNSNSIIEELFYTIHRLLGYIDKFPSIDKED